MNCSRCGIHIDITVIEKRQARGNNNTNCSDCNAKPLKKTPDNCIPWTGEVDDDWNPIDQYGRPHRPGVRTCGHKDCVNRNHIIPDIESERLDISYRTGKKFDMKRVMRERVA